MVQGVDRLTFEAGGGGGGGGGVEGTDFKNLQA